MPFNFKAKTRRKTIESVVHGELHRGRRGASDHDNEDFFKAAWVMRSTFQA